jgi:hypothetical protein
MSEVMPWDDYEDDADGYCDCQAFHTISEMDSGKCDCCGKPICPEEYS